MNYGHCDIVLETGIKTIPPQKKDHPQEEEIQKSKMTVQGGLTNSCEKKRSKKQRRKGKLYPFECRVPKNSKETLIAVSITSGKSPI